MRVAPAPAGESNGCDESHDAGHMASDSSSYMKQTNMEQEKWRADDEHNRKNRKVIYSAFSLLGCSMGGFLISGLYQDLALFDRASPSNQAANEYQSGKARSAAERSRTPAAVWHTLIRMVILILTAVDLDMNQRFRRMPCSMNMLFIVLFVMLFTTNNLEGHLWQLIGGLPLLYGAIRMRQIASSEEQVSVSCDFVLVCCVFLSHVGTIAQFVDGSLSDLPKVSVLIQNATQSCKYCQTCFAPWRYCRTKPDMRCMQIPVECRNRCTECKAVISDVNTTASQQYSTSGAFIPLRRNPRQALGLVFYGVLGLLILILSWWIRRTWTCHDSCVCNAQTYPNTKLSTLRLYRTLYIWFVLHGICLMLVSTDAAMNSNQDLQPTFWSGMLEVLIGLAGLGCRSWVFAAVAWKPGSKERNMAEETTSTKPRPGGTIEATGIAGGEVDVDTDIETLHA